MVLLLLMVTLNLPDAWLRSTINKKGRGNRPSNSYTVA
jgi:hypothetical protein